MKKYFAILIICLGLCSFAEAATFNVPADYPDIKTAVAIASSGDEVVVADNTYTGAGNRDIDFGGRDIVVRSASNDPAACIIDCQGLGRGFIFQNGETGAAVVRGFTIKNGGEVYGGAIECIDASPTIDNCILTNNTAFYGGAIECFDFSSPTIINCVITNNTSDTSGGAIGCGSDSSPTIRNCLIENNTASGDGGAIECYDASSPVITNCTIVNNTGAINRGGVYAPDSSNPVIRNSILWNNGDDIDGASVSYSCIEDGDAGTGNISDDPIFKTGPLGDYYLSQIAGGQLADSNAVNAGGDDAMIVFGAGHSYTTATNNTIDATGGNVDMGYHYMDSGSVTQYNLISIVDPNGNFGSISPNIPTPGVAYDEFSEIAITATPDANFTISSWNGTDNDSSVDANNVVTMTSDKIVTVKFVGITTQGLTTSTIGNGAVDPNGLNMYPKYTQVEIIATPTAGYVLDKWCDGNTATFDINNPATYTVTAGPILIYTATMDVNTTVIAEFVEDPCSYRFDARVVPDGSGLAHGTVSPRRQTFPQNMVVTVTATPDADYAVRRWTGTDNDSNLAATNTVTMNSDKNITVEFSKTFSITTGTYDKNDPNGGIDPNGAFNPNILANITDDSNVGFIDPNHPFGSNGIIYQNETATFTANPALGYEVSAWFDTNPNNFNALDPSTYNLVYTNTNTHNVVADSNKVVKAYFQPVTLYTLTTVTSDGVTINPDYSAGQIFSAGTTITLTATIPAGANPNDVLFWSGTDNDNSMELTNWVTINSNTTVTVGMRSPKIIHFSGIPPYLTLQDALNDAGNKDTIFIADGTYPGTGFTINKSLTIIGNPGNPNAVVIDCNNFKQQGFTLNSNRPILLNGITVTNVDYSLPTPLNGEGSSWDPNHVRHDGSSGSQSWGGGIIIQGNHTVANCIVRNCIARGGSGREGVNGAPHDLSAEPKKIPVHNGGWGGDGGSAFGAGIFILWGSPVINNTLIEDCHATGGNGAYGGNGLDADNSDPFDSNFPGGSGGNGGNGGDAFGGGIACGINGWAGSPTFTDCIIRNCETTGGRGGDGGSGGLDARQGAIAVDPCDPNTIVQVGYGQGGHGGCPGESLGGGIYVDLNSTATFNNCKITNNVSRSNVAGCGGNSSMYSGTIRGHWAGGLGGLCDNDTVQNAINTAIGDVNYASIFAADPNLHFGTTLILDPQFVVVPQQTNFVIKQNGWTAGLTPISQITPIIMEEYTAKGGGIFLGHNATANFNSCAINKNQTQGSITGVGGYNINKYVGSNNSNYSYPAEHYRVPGFGSGIYVDDDSFTSFISCDIKGSYSIENDTNDPALLLHYSGDHPSNTDVYGDEYTGYGGGLCFDGIIGSSTMTYMQDCNVSDNNAPIGGGIYAQDMAQFDINDCNISGNLAILGGGLFSIGNVSDVNKTTFKDNIANAFLLTQDSDDTFGYGGAIYHFTGDTSFLDCVITDNASESDGGGFYIGGSDPALASPTISNCLITGNEASIKGGGVCLDIYAAATISNSTIAHNKVTGPNSFGGGFSGDYGSDAILIDSILWGNTAINGSQISVLDSALGYSVPARLTITHSDVELRATQGFDFGSGSSSSSGSSTAGLIIDSQTIQSNIDANGFANVIITMVDSSSAGSTNWNSTTSVATLQGEIATIQQQVLSTFDTGEFTVSQQLQNMPIVSGSVTQSGLDKLITNSAVAHIEPVRTVYPALAQGLPLMNALSSRSTFNGSGTSVAIVDTGIDYTHTMLGGGGFPNAKVIGGYDTGENDSDPMPVGEAHGTNCAGISAGTLGNVGDYIGGVAYNAKLYALKASPDNAGWFDNDAVIAAWDWCITHKNDDSANPILVISNSLGGGKYDSAAEADIANPAYLAAAARANDAGITVVAASGNDGFTDGLGSPSALSNIISVGAVYDGTFLSGACGVMTTPDNVTCYSNTADFLDILAPSENAYTTDIVGPDGYSNDDYYQFFNGTSSACPYAAGAIAALQSAAIESRGSVLSPEEVRILLVASGDSVTDTKVAITKPRINLGTAIAMLGNTAPIFLESGCTLDGLEPNAADANQWDVSAGSNNIDDDPGFIYGYYLSHLATNQDFDSNAIDAGSALAATLGLDIYTTRTDGVNDVGIVDMGYHYMTNIPSYTLTLAVIQPGLPSDVNYYGYIEFDWNDANTTVETPYSIYESTIVNMEAVPDVNYRVAKWVIGTQTIETRERNQTIVMTDDIKITVEFEFYEPRHLFVPDEYATIQEAVDNAEPGDTVYIYRKDDGSPHYITNPDGIDLKGKAITIRSEDPTDSNIVAETIIDCQNNSRAFIFQNGEDANTIIEGLTIINGLAAGDIGYPGGDGPYDPCDPDSLYNGGDASGDGYGGAMYFGILTSPIIRNCVIRDCRATGGIGGDGADGKTVWEGYGGESPYAEPEDDRAGAGGNGGDGTGSGYGGAFYCNTSSEPTIRNCRIENCAASGGLGGDGGQGGDAYDGKIRGDGGDAGNGIGSGYGGMVYCEQQAYPMFISCELPENSATMGTAGERGLRGSGDEAPDDRRPAYDGSYGYESGSGFGGVGYYSQYSFLDFSGCSILNNESVSDGSGNFDDGGGAFYFEPNCADAMLVDCNLYGNTAVGSQGGAIKCKANNVLDINSCYFGGNSADGDGGAIYIGDAEDANTVILKLNSCAITDNTSGGFGGGIYATSFDANLVDCYINRNTATSGGGMYLTGKADVDTESELSFFGGTILNNTANGDYANGGGAYIVNLRATIVNVRIEGNSSQYAGGGIMFRGIKTTESIIHNCLFTKNTAVARGGGVLASINSSPEITSCTFVENDVAAGGMGGAILCINNSSPTITNCIFADSGQVAVYEGSADSDVDMSYCMFAKNHNGDYFEFGTAKPYKTYGATDPNELAGLNKSPNSNNIVGLNASSDFVEGTLGDYYLNQAMSPAVDNGEGLAKNANLPNDTNMADYTTDSNDVFNADGGLLDIGYHYPDPNTLVKYTLTTTVDGGNGAIVVDPYFNDNMYYTGTTVKLEAVPNTGWRVNQWFGTDDDTKTNKINYITIIGDGFVTVSYEQPDVLYVPSQYTAIQYAINDAKSGDKIVLAPGTYPGPDTNFDYSAITINGKNIVITSSNPDDPCVVADTVFAGSRWSISNVDRTMIIDGITIRDAHFGGASGGCPGGLTGDGHNGWSFMGGAIGLYNASPTIRNTKFVNCSTFGGAGAPACEEGGDGGWGGFARGGAVGISLGSDPLFTKCEFIDCYVRGGNGGNAAEQGGHGGSWGDPNDDVWHTWDFAPAGGYEDYWYYSGYGGAVYCMPGTKPVFEDCLFQGNRAYGGVCGDSTGWSWPYHNYVIDSFGGAIFVAAGSEPNFTDCSFIDNEADTRGQIGDNFDPCEPNNVNFTLPDSVISYGGAIAAELGAVLNLTNCDFSENIACAGGSIYLDDADTLMNNCKVENSKSMLGGGLCMIDSNSIISQSQISSNTAINPTGQGGGIYSASSGMQFIDSQLYSNIATVSGGGAYFGGEREPNMFNCLIVNNTANRDGGGISANWYAQLLLSNCTIANNNVTGGDFTSSYGGGLSAAYYAYVEVINSIIWSNTAAYGPSISIGSIFDPNGKPMAEVKVSYSDIRGGEANVFVDTPHEAVLDWGAGNLLGTSLDDPNFVTGLMGDYYLSQTSTGDSNQSVDSPAVNTGNAMAVDIDMYRHTTRTDHELDFDEVDMGYHYLMYTANNNISCDYNYDGIVDMQDLSLFLIYWLQDDCQFPGWCRDRDLTQDGDVDMQDYSFFANEYTKTEKTPPSPDPMTWVVPPHSAGNFSIEMQATIAIDDFSNPVEYYFACVYNPNGDGSDSGWSTDSIYENINLTQNVAYGYQVQARDARGNETDWSVVGYAVPGEDTTKPEPNIMTWAVEPEVIPLSPNSVTMTATTATDISGVEYYFDETSESPGANDSDWQDSPTYIDYGLDPNTTYSYYVIARDKSDNQNATGASPTESVTTPAEGEDPNTTEPEAGTWLTAPRSGEIYGVGTGNFYHFMTANLANNENSSYIFRCETSGYEQEWEQSSDPESPYYTANPNYFELYVGGSNNDREYSVRIKNSAGIEGAKSPSLLTVPL